MLLQQIINGLAQGSIYALVGIGFALIFGVLGLVHFAHGEVYMLGSIFWAFALITVFHLPVFPSLLTAIIASSIVGIMVERLVFKPLRKAPDVAPMVCTLGLSVVLQNVAMLVWGSDTKSVPDVTSGAVIPFLRSCFNFSNFNFCYFTHPDANTPVYSLPVQVRPSHQSDCTKQGCCCFNGS